MATHAPTTPNVRPSRRDLLSAAGFTGMAAVAAAGFAKPENLAGPGGSGSVAPNPDARLLSLVAAFLENERSFEALHASWSETRLRDIPNWVDEQSRGMVDRCHRLRRLIGLIPARTREGMVAKARAALAHSSMASPENLDQDSDDFIVWSLCHDLVRGTAA